MMETDDAMRVVVRFRPIPEEAPIGLKGQAAEKMRKMAAQWRWTPTTITSVSANDNVRNKAGHTSPSPAAQPQAAGVGSEFRFTTVYDPSTATTDVYTKTAKPIVQAFLKGCHGCIFAFGQTNSGKTHTILGDADRPGIVPLAVNDVFRHIGGLFGQQVCMLKISFMELYNEVIRDLLAENAPQLQILDDSINGAVIPHLTGHLVGSLADVLELIKKGDARRSVAANMGS